jgi:hypothetical protein
MKVFDWHGKKNHYYIYKKYIYLIYWIEKKTLIIQIPQIYKKNKGHETKLD